MGAAFAALGAASVRPAMATGCQRIAQGDSAVAVDSQGEGCRPISGDIKLVSLSAQSGSVIKGGGGDVFAQPAVGHVPSGIIAGLYGNIAGLGKGNGELAVNKFVCADIIAVFLAGIVCAIDIAEQIIVNYRLCAAADGADTVFIAVGALQAAGGANTVGIAVGTCDATHSADTVRIAVGALIFADGADTAGPFMRAAFTATGTHAFGVFVA